MTSLSYTLILLTNPASQYFTVTNSGTRLLVATNYTITQSMSGLSLSGIDVILKSCATAWNQSGAGSCSGGATTIGSFSGASFAVRSTTSTTAPLASGTVLHLQASVTGVGITVATLTVGITTSVNSEIPTRDISPLTITNS